jgi:polysaccharide export outer membrane protein
MPRFIFITLISCILLAQNAVAQEEYTVKPGDIITVTVWERQTLSSTATVDANGNITLPVPIGDVKVVGLTAKQISDLLTERLKEYIINPTIFVSVTPAQTFMVHIIGEVVSPNFYNVPDGTSIQELVTIAGGLTQFADIKHVRLIRTSPPHLS